MKRLFLLLFLCISNYAFSQYFEFQVDTDTPNETFTIPTDSSLSYDYTVEVFTFGNPNVTTHTNVTGDLTLTFAPGSHIIRILEGSLFPRIHFANSPDKLKIVFIYRWGNNLWSTMEEAFEGCANLKIQAPDTPNLTNVTSTNRMFRDATVLEDTSSAGNIGNWDMSTVENMGQMFRGCSAFNEDISDWDTSNAESFTRMFQGATAFDQNLGNWDISNVTSTGAIFAQAGVSTSNYDQTIIGWGTLDPGETAIPTGLNMRFDNSTYCTAAGIRNTLSNSPFNWVFTDNGLNCTAISDDTLFITTWETTTSNETITIPAVGASQGYYVDWGDGQTNNSVTGSTSHTYSNAGIHTIKIGGQFSGIRFAGGGDRLKIQSIDQWGAIPWTSMFEAFEGCSNLTYTATDAPDLSRVTQLDRMFSGCSSFNASNLNNWDISTIESVTFMFNGASNFNGNITGWDVSNITDFRNMLTDNINFNQNISGWTINNSEPVDMGGMFAGTLIFNQPIGSWNVSQVTDMQFMLERALDFNQPLTTWDVSNVTNMKGMFFETFDFNQSLESWDISSITDAELMLRDSGLSTTNYDATLIGWATLDTGETQIPIDINLGAVGLEYCTAAIERQDLDDNFNWTFVGDSFECGPESEFITTWETTSANESITIPTVDNETYHYTIDWGDGSPIETITSATTPSHQYATIGTYTVSIEGVFPRIDFLINSNANNRQKIISIDQWGDIEWSSMKRAFFGCERLQLSAIDAPNLQFVTSLDSMFQDCDALESPDLSNWDVSTIINLDGMFAGSTSLTTPNFSGWNLNNVITMNSMFAGCQALTIPDFSGWNTSNVTDMKDLFSGAFNFNGNITGWDVGKVTDFSEMFHQAIVFNQNISNWNIGANTTDPILMNFMFGSAATFDQDISNWDVSKVTNMASMFQNAQQFNQDLNAWDVSSVSNMNEMFRNDFGITAFNRNLSDWDISSVTNMGDMFTNADMISIENYDATLIGWARLDPGETQIPSNINLGATGLQYCESSLARRDLLFNNNWTFNDDGIGCSEEDKFITVWKTTSANENIRLQVNGDRFYTVEWGDGTIDTDQFTNAEHTYAQAGTYEVKISGYLGGLRYNNLPAGSSTRLKLYEIKQWGIQPWERMADSYYGCENLKVTATDIPDLSQITDISDMFRNCFSLEDLGGKMGTWDVSTIENFNTMFQNTTVFSRSLGDWDLSSATNMSNMLNNSGLSSNNYDLTLIGWRNNVNTPSGISLGATGLTYCNAVNEHSYLDNDLNWTLNDAGINCPTDEPFITRWETTTTNETITIPTTASTQYFVDWGDGTPITTESGNATHNYTTAGLYDVKITGGFLNIRFNSSGDINKIQSIEQWGAIEWNTMIRAFRGCSNLVINATDVPDLSKVTSMQFMFDGTTSLVDNGNRIGDWNISNVTQTGYMFDDSSFNENINNWDVSNVEFMGFMFRNNPNFNQSLDNWELSNDVNLFEAFNNATAFNQDLGSWDISGVTSMGNMLNNSGMSTENYDNTLIGWATLSAGETQIPSDISLGATGLNYCASETERTFLTNAPYNWIITDAGLSCDVQLATKVYLQGAYTNPNTGEETLMRDDLRVAGLIPTTSPYDSTTCDASVFNATGTNAIVDWVLIELRDPTDNTSIIASQSALLQRDGDIVATDGISPVAMSVTAGDYYIAVKHRNHLGVLSSNTTTLSINTTAVDLSSSTTTVTGGALAVRDMGNGIFAMYAGDSTGDGNILNTDISNAIGASGGIDVYSGADANMDGNILNTDIALIIQPNAGRIQQF